MRCTRFISYYQILQMNPKTVKDMWVHDDYKTKWLKSYQELCLWGHIELQNPKRKYTVAIYRQHKNWYFYLKRIWRIIEVNKREWLFESEVLVVKLSKKICSTKRKVHIVLYPYRYKKALIESLPDQTNPYNMNKWKNWKRKNSFSSYISEPLFEITLDKVS